MPATAYAALLRAVNVGGTGKLAMADLARLCAGEGFGAVRTYIQSGNVVFTSQARPAAVKATLERVLTKHMGKPVAVMIRTAAELEATLTGHPFQGVAPNRLLIVFLDEPPAPNALEGVIAPGGEEVAVRGREIFIHYPNGMGVSKLKMPNLTKAGTGRNLNTVAKLAAMTRALVP